MKTKFTKLSVVIAAFAATTGSAQASSVNAHSFVPAANPSYTFTEDAILGTSWNQNGGERSKGKAFFSAFYDMVNDPLVELDARQTTRRSTLVESMNSLSLTLGYGIISRVQIGASTALSLVRMPDGRNQFGLGDSRLFTKIRLNNEDRAVVFALMPEVWAPTGNRGLFLSDSRFSAGMRLIAERDFGPIVVAGNAGFHYSPGAVFRDLDMRRTVPLSLGILVPVGSKWALNADASGELPLPINSNTNPSAFYAGARYRLPSNFMVSFGGAVGSVNGYSSADYRIIAGLTLIPESKATIVIAEAPAPVLPPVSAVQKEEPPRVVFTPKEVILNEEVKFMHAKAILTDSGKNLLDEVAKVLKENDASYKLVVVEGHTNVLGTFDYNQKLSEERAASVREYLASRGIEAKRLMPVGYGKTKIKHIAGLSKDAELEANRRVAFKVVQ